MNYSYLEAIEKIKDKLTSSGFQSLEEDINKLQLSGGIGGEVIQIVCSKLIEIKHTNKDAFCHIEQEAAGLIEYAHSIYIIPMWKGKQ